MTAGPHFRYSRWDGTQVGFELDAGDVFSEITDDLLYHGDLEAALRRLLQQGFRERFEELLDKLRQQLMQRQVNQMAGAMENMSPADIARMKDMMAELNRMLDQRANGEEPDFAQFMENFGDLFPENPQSLDELLEVMAQRMAAMQAM